MSFKLFAWVVVVSALTISIVSAYNPDQDAQTDKIIRMHNYECQNHDVRTEDDYLLTLHRIPRGRKPNTKKKTPVYLQHGLLGSSADWIIQGPERSLAYKLADEGHDVWLGNVRGNTYSRLHASISPDTKKFWDFSFHEMGVFDVPATIDYILNKTGSEQVYYIGHSMGTTMFYVLCSVRPEYNAKIKMMFSLAPIAFMSHAGTPLRALTNHLETYEVILETLKSNGELFRRSSLMDWLMKTLCDQNILEARFCEEVIFMICGTDIKEYDLDLQPILLSHTPAGTSIKTLVHYGQLIKSGYFREYDYLKFDNREKYHNDTPPNYDLSRITAPVSLHYSANDLLANVTDVYKLLYALLPHVVAADEVEDKDFNHLDFIYSKDVNKLLNNNIIDRIYRSESGLPPPPKRNHAEMIIPRRSEYPEFNDFSTSSEHQEAYPMDEEILDNVVNLKTMAEKRLETINEKAKLAINRNLKGFKRLLMLELKKHSNGAHSYAENKLIKWKNEVDVY